MNTQNHRAVEEFFNNLLERGLQFEEDLLFIVDGSKGLIKAINHKFKGYALIQRCLWHKLENVLSHLSKSCQSLWRKKLRQAYAKTTHQEAEATLNDLVAKSDELNPTAANSLKEGMSDTTLHKLGLNQIFRRSFSTTNCIESILAQVEQYTQALRDRWRNGAHIQRWVAVEPLEVKPRLKRVYS